MRRCPQAKHGFKGVRGGQGKRKNQFQGVTPQKRHRTALFNTAFEAAVAFEELKRKLPRSLEYGHLVQFPEPPSKDKAFSSFACWKGKPVELTKDAKPGCLSPH